MAAFPIHYYDQYVMHHVSCQQVLDVTHTMDRDSLVKYVTATKFSEDQKALIQAAIEDVIPIEVHGIYEKHLSNVLEHRGYSIISKAERQPRREKKYNNLRPVVARVRKKDKGDERLFVIAFPSPEFVDQISEILSAYIAGLTGSGSAFKGAKSQGIQVFQYPALAEKLAEWSGLHDVASRVVQLGDITVLGHVDLVQLRLSAHGYEVAEHFPIDQGWYGDITIATQRATGNRVLLIGIRHTYWGSAAGRICRCLAECGATDIIYIAKTGTFLGAEEIHSLVCPDTYYLLQRADTGSTPERWNWSRFEVPSEFRQQLAVEIRAIASGVHLTVPTVMGETIAQSEEYRRLRPATIDNEIGYMAEAIASYNWTVGHAMRTHLTCLHFVTDYLDTGNGTQRQRHLFDLSDVDGARGVTVRERQTQAFDQATDFLAKYVETRHSKKADPTVSVRVTQQFPRVTNWTGRTRELEELEQAFAMNQRRSLVLIRGGPGVGKTTLVSQWAEEYLRSNSEYLPMWVSMYPDPVTKATPDFHEVADALLHRLSTHSSRIGESKRESYTRKIHSILELVQRRQTLLIFDGVESLLAKGSSSRAGCFLDESFEYLELFRALCQMRGSTSRIVLVSRETPTELPTQLYLQFPPLGGLSDEEGSVLLRKLGLSGDENALRELTARYAGNPKALELVSPLIRDDPNFCGHVDKFLADRHWVLTVELERLIEQVFARLGPDELVCVRRIAVYDTIRFPLWRAAILAQVPELPTSRERETVIAALLRRSVLEKGRIEGSFDLHPLVRELALSQLRRQNEGLEVANALAHVYFRDLPLRGPDLWESIADIIPRLESIRHAYAARRYREAALVACDSSFRRALVRWGEHRQIVQAYEPIANAIAAGLISNEDVPNCGAQVYNMIGIAFRNLNRLDDAIKALQLGLGNRSGNSATWNGILLGNLCLSLIDYGDFVGAEASALEARQTAAESGDRRGEAYALGNLGIAKYRQKQYAAAFDYLAEDILLSSLEDDNIEGIAHAYGVLGQISVEQGDGINAIRYLAASVTAFRALSNRYRELEFTQTMVQALTLSGDHASAVHYAMRCRSLAGELVPEQAQQFEVIALDRISHIFSPYDLERMPDNKAEVDFQVSNHLAKICGNSAGRWPKVIRAHMT